ncbi:MAG: mevalonate kinase [Halobacteria archaeon]
MPARSSAPGAAFLLGEHAVVYDEPAVLLAVDRRATVTVESAPDDDLPDSPYVREAIDRARQRADETTPVRVKVKSDVPVGAGLGSSAAVTVATLHAAARELGEPMGTETVAREAHVVERSVQGEASPADTYTSAMGGYVVVGGDERRRLDAPDAEFVVGYDGGSAPTGEMVENVARLVDGNRVASDIVGSIGNLSRRGVEDVKNGDFEDLGDLMDMNQGLLDALGVSSSSLSRMVWAARDEGGNAKLTGAGGAGCVVAYPSDEPVREAVAEEAQDVYAVSPAQGVRAE